jgi:hypothetical protein
MSTRRIPITCPPCSKPGTLHGPAVTLKFTPKKPAPLATGVALNEIEWKDDKGEEVDCTICAYPMSADSEANPWTGPGLFLTQACVNGHVYHKGCLLTHMSRSNFNTATCPECRNPILSEVAASLRRNGAPAPVPPPLNSGGGGLFGGGGGGLFGGGNAPAPAQGGGLFGGGGGGLFGSGNAPAPAPAQRRNAVRDRSGDRPSLSNDDAASLWDRIHGGGDLPPPPQMERGGTLSEDGAAWWRGEISRDEAERRSQERRRMEGEAMRGAQLPYQSLAPFPPMTGVNGYFFLVGGLDANPTPFEIKEAMPYRVQDEFFYAERMHIRMSEQNLDPFHNPPHGMTVTLVQYEFNELTDEEGNTFVGYYLDTVGVPGGLVRFYKEFFNLPTTPKVDFNGAPKWGEDPLGRPPTLQITPDEYDAWAREVREEREALQPPPGPRTRARAAREVEAAALVPAEERESLDEF